MYKHIPTRMTPEELLRYVLDHKEAIAQRLWSKVDKTPGLGPQGNCWIWTGVVKKGAKRNYAKFKILGNSYPAHRVCLIVEGRLINPNLYACHHCDWPPCCRPDHLFPGTHADNMKDAALKNRLPTVNVKGQPARGGRKKFQWPTLEFYAS